jgi:nitrogen regulatory protein P-II 1
MKMIWAVVRWSKMQSIAAALKEVGVSGCTVYPVRGYGEEWHVYEALVHGGHYKLELIVEDAQAERAVARISEEAWTGLPGDGLLSVFGVDTVMQLRTKQVLR